MCDPGSATDSKLANESESIEPVGASRRAWNKTRLVLPLVLAAISLASTAYFAWCWQRSRPTIFAEDMSYPRPWPYPDRWLCDLVDWFDARNPTQGDTIKIHGEWPKVRLLVFLALALSFQLLAAAIVLFRRRSWEIRRYSVIPHSQS
jgi:hypothetical protein